LLAAEQLCLQELVRILEIENVIFMYQVEDLSLLVLQPRILDSSLAGLLLELVVLLN